MNSVLQLTGAVRRRQLAEAGLADAVSVEPLVFNPNNAATVTVERLVLDDGSTVVRKVLARDAPVTVAHWAAGANPAHWNHWRREADAYRSGAVRVFEPHLRAPGLFGAMCPDSSTEVLLLEDLPGATGDELSIGTLGSAARRLGGAQAQGARTTNHPTDPGFFAAGSREWIWAYATTRPPGPAGHLDPASWDHPVVVGGFGSRRHELRRRYLEVLSELPRWRRLLAACPRTLCHLDFGPRNIFAVSGSGDASGGDPVVALVDWSFAGVGAVGEDPGQLVAESMLEHFFEPEAYAELDREVWEAYASGLADSGWRHDLRWARLAMCIAVLRFVWMPAAMVASADHRGPTGYARGGGPVLVEVFRRRAMVFQHMLERIDEAGTLATQLGLG